MKMKLPLVAFALSLAALAEPIDPAAFGFDPAADPAVNSAALQKALDGGNKEVFVKKPGTYGVDRTMFIDSHTKLTFAKGVVLQKRGEMFANVLINRGAYNYGHDEDIEVRGLEISVNDNQMVPSLDSPARNVRGHLAFFNAKHVRVYDFRCVDLGNWQYCVHFCSFEDVLVDGFEIRGKKDGIHFNCGRGFVVRNGVLCTCDDGIAVNAGDWPDCSPETGDVADGLVEHVVMEPTPPSEKKKPGELGLAIAASWVDWYPGIKLQRNDIVRAGKNVYGIFPMAFTTNEYASMTMPTHSRGKWTSPEGINFFCMQTNGILRADVKNVVFRDVVCNHPRGLRMGWEVGSPWARCVRSELKPEDYPRIELTFERVKMTHPGTPVICGAAPGCVTIKDCSVNDAPIAIFGVPRQVGGKWFPGTKRRLVCSGCKFSGDKRIDFKFSGPTEVDLVVDGNSQTRDLKAYGEYGAKINLSGDAKVEVVNAP